MRPLSERTRHSQKELQSALSKQRKKKTPRKKDLAAAAKWRSWQTPTGKFLVLHGKKASLKLCSFIIFIKR